MSDGMPTVRSLARYIRDKEKSGRTNSHTNKKFSALETKLDGQSSLSATCQGLPRRPSRVACALGPVAASRLPPSTRADLAPALVVRRSGPRLCLPDCQGEAPQARLARSLISKGLPSLISSIGLSPRTRFALYFIHPYLSASLTCSNAAPCWGCLSIFLSRCHRPCPGKRCTSRENLQRRAQEMRRERERKVYQKLPQSKRSTST